MRARDMYYPSAVELFLANNVSLTFRGHLLSKEKKRQQLAKGFFTYRAIAAPSLACLNNRATILRIALCACVHMKFNRVRSRTG